MTVGEVEKRIEDIKARRDEAHLALEKLDNYINSKLVVPVLEPQTVASDGNYVTREIAVLKVPVERLKKDLGEVYHTIDQMNCILAEYTRQLRHIVDNTEVLALIADNLAKFYEEDK